MRTAAFRLLPRTLRSQALKRPKGHGPEERFMGSFLFLSDLHLAHEPVGRVRPGEPLDVRGTRPTRLAGDRLALPSGSREEAI